MNRIVTICFFLLLSSSCIPLRIAPNIKDYKIAKGKKFKRGLPKKNMFIFEDPKDENEFYNYVNTKFQLQDYYVGVQVPFELNGSTYYFSFYEVEIPTKTINLIPLAIDGILIKTANMDPLLEKVHTSRIGSWYIAIEVFSDLENDCLANDFIFRPQLLTYLSELKKEYLNTVNYNEAVFKN